MKVKNESIIIKNGEKIYEFKNLILDAYLTRFVSRQMDIEYNKVSRLLDLDYCLLKFDEPLQFDAHTKVNNQDFDICFLTNAATKIGNQILVDTNCTIKYQYDFDENEMVYDYSINRPSYVREFYGRKITAIGFNAFWARSTLGWDVPVCAILDVSNYDIYLQENQVFTVTRKDSISSDALFWSNNPDKVPGACHLAPRGGQQVIYQPDIVSQDGASRSMFYDYAFGIIYSVGLSNSIDRIEKEYVIGTDVEMQQNGPNLTIKNIPNNVSVARTFLSRFLPFYPTRSNYKYFIIKYKVWQMVHSGTYDNIIQTNTDTGYYYHMAIPTDGTGNKDITIKYERS